MKLHIAFDLTDLPKALEIAEQTAEYADAFEIGTLLLYKEGVKAIEAFHEAFPSMPLFVNAQITKHATKSVDLLIKAGAHTISVLAGSGNKVLHHATDTASAKGGKIALDLLDSYSIGESARDAENRGVDMIIFHLFQEKAGAVDMPNKWEVTKGNTKLPIFISGDITKENLKDVLGLSPTGIVVGRAITEAGDPSKAAKHFHTKISK